MADKMKTLGVRVTAEEAENIDDKAKKKDMNLSEYVRESIFMFSNFDDNFIEFITRFSKDLNIPVQMVIQNIVINKLARDAAREEIWGAEGQEPMVEFQLTNKGFVTGKELFDNLFESYSREFSVKKKEADIELAGFQNIGKKNKKK